MRCGIKKGAALLLCLGASVATAADFLVNVNYDGNRVYSIVYDGNKTVKKCAAVNASGISLSATSVDSYTYSFFSDRNCRIQIASIEGSDLFKEENAVTIQLSQDGDWSFGAVTPGEIPGQNPPKDDTPQKTDKKTIAFFTPWSNTNAILFVDGDSVATMTAMDKYCGWFKTTVNPTANGLKVYFKQTIGVSYVGAEGLVKTEPTTATEIALDSVAVLSDTIWVQGYKNDAPAVFSKYPGVLGDCPLKKLPVTVFDWLHGDKGDGDGAGRNGDPANGVSADFGSGGCSNVKGMVQYDLGQNGVPVPADPFPSACKITTHLADWFLPEVVAKDAQGTPYTNMTCRDLYLSMDDEGFWLAEVSKDRISKGNEMNKGGMFLLDNFQYLDEAKTVKNPYFDWLDGSGGKHNFGFTVKIQAQFEYVPGQYFDFYGDDDVWVFIDNRLAVDIGGQHAQVAGAVLLDTIGQNNGKKLIPGETYDFHIFYVERHVSSSNFRMHTSIDLQVDASLFLQSYVSGNITNYNVWQINKKNKLSCGYDPNNTEVDTTGGPATYKLTGGNLDQPEILGIGTHYEGIMITSDSTFSIDSAKIVENMTLSPGHYFLEITLKSDPSQSTKVEIIIPSYAVPSVAFATEQWKILGKEVSGDTLQIGEWAFATYQVNITFFEEWAQVTNYNKKINLSFTDPSVDILDAPNGKKISSITLDDKGRATFYVHANAAVQDVSLIAKGTAASASLWKNLNFNNPPIPQIKNAIIVDRNGDGRADSLYVSYDRALKGESTLDSIQFTFGESFATTTKFKLLENGTDLVVTAEQTGKNCSEANCGFGSRQFTGGESAPYTGTLNSWFTYVKDNKSTQFHAESESIADGVGPILLKAVKNKLKDGNRELTITMSEALTDESREEFLKLFDFICMRSGIQKVPEKAAQQSGSGSTFILIYSPSTKDAILPDNGDQIRFAIDAMTAQDLSGNSPHKNNPWVTITGDQEMSNETPGVIQVGEDPYGIIANKQTTQPTLIANINQDAQAIGDSLGVQGHLIDFDISKIMFEETQKDINALDAFILDRLGSTTSYDTVITGITEAEALEQLFKDIAAGMVGEAYGISEETVAAVVSGTITKDNYKGVLSKDEISAISTLVNESVEASRDTVINVGSISSTTQEDIFEAIRQGTLDEDLKKAGISSTLIEAIKNGTLDGYNIDEFRNGSKTLVSDSAVVLHYQTRYYSQLGEYVGGDSKTIRCSDETVYGQGGCKENKGKLFLAWNMRSHNGRIVGTGVYIARLQIQIKVNGKVTHDETRDKFMGVRRGKTNDINFDF